MVLKKQTIWLLTMLTLMVVLSAYYLYNPPADNEYVSEENTDQMSQDAEQTSSEETTDQALTDLEGSEWLDVVGDLDTDFSVSETDESSPNTTDEESSSLDAVLAQRLEKEAQRAEQLEHYENMMSSSDATAQTIAEAKSEYDALHDLAAAEETLEGMIKEEGYEEAVVIADEDRVNVLVSTGESLTSAEAVEIIHLVQEHLDIPGNQVYVTYK